jgi:hypothetical protein
MRYLPFIGAACVGAGVWLGIGAWSGAWEAWDSPLYWTVGFPVMASCAFLISVFEPQKPWRWGGMMMLAQALCGFALAFPDISLWPLSLAIHFVLSLPLIAAAYLGSLVNGMLRLKAA